MTEKRLVGDDPDWVAAEHIVDNHPDKEQYDENKIAATKKMLYWRLKMMRDLGNLTDAEFSTKLREKFNYAPS